MALRIAHVTATFPPYRGGTGNVCLHNARELARRGHQVTVLTAAAPNAVAYEERDGFVVQRLQPLVRIGNAPLLPGLFAALRGFDIVHLHYPFILGAELTALMTLTSGTPLVITFHNDLIGDGGRAAIFRAYQQISAQLTVRRANVLCGVSLDHLRHSRLRHSLGSHAPRMVELSNGVDTDMFSPGASQIRSHYDLDNEIPLVLFVAALDRAHHFKGLSNLLLALTNVTRKVCLLVVGDGDMRQAYEEEAVHLGLAKQVIFAGAIDQADLPPYYRAADLTILPSDVPESFGLVLIESLACATPVVASNLPGVRTVVEHGNDGVLVPPGDVTALTIALDVLLGNPVQRKAMGRCGRAKVLARYAWPMIGTRLEQIYAEVLGGYRSIVKSTTGDTS